MPSPSGFKRIARDLEKLPCELHEGIIAELEFEQLIRLCTCAGPRLQWSLENSVSPWGRYISNESTIILQRLLAITDQVKRLAFKSSRTQESQAYTFKHETLSFLRRRNEDWNLPAGNPYWHLHLPDYKSLVDHWLASLNRAVITTIWRAFHQDYRKLIKPWIASVDGIAGAFDNIPHIGESVPDSNLPTRDMETAFSIDELARFIDAYQKLRLKRAEVLAEELHHLANIYDAHPKRVKTPFAPQTQRRNEKHIPAALRYEASKMLREAEKARWSNKDLCKYRFRFIFPALIPYNSTIMLFNELWQDIATNLPKETSEKYRLVIEEAPLWVTRSMPGSLRNSPEHPLEIIKQECKGSPLCPPIIEEFGDEYVQHPEQIKWLETFLEIVAMMEGRFPNVLGIARIELSQGNQGRGLKEESTDEI